MPRSGLNSMRLSRRRYLTPADLDAPVVSHRDLAVQGRLGQRPGQLQLREELDAGDAVDHGERPDRGRAARRGRSRPAGPAAPTARRPNGRSALEARRASSVTGSRYVRAVTVALPDRRAPLSARLHDRSASSWLRRPRGSSRNALRSVSSIASPLAARRPTGRRPSMVASPPLNCPCRPCDRDAGLVDHQRSRPVGHRQSPWLNDHAAVFDRDRPLQIAGAARAGHFHVEGRSSADPGRDHEVEQRHRCRAVQPQSSRRALEHADAARRHDRGIRAAPLEGVDVHQAVLEPQRGGPLGAQLDVAHRQVPTLLLHAGAHGVEARRRRGPVHGQVQRAGEVRWRLVHQLCQHRGHGHGRPQREPCRFGGGIAARGGALAQPPHRNGGLAGRPRCPAPCRQCRSRGAFRGRHRPPPSRRWPVPVRRDGGSQARGWPVRLAGTCPGAHPRNSSAFTVPSAVTPSGTRPGASAVMSATGPLTVTTSSAPGTAAGDRPISSVLSPTVSRVGSMMSTTPASSRARLGSASATGRACTCPSRRVSARSTVRFGKVLNRPGQVHGGVRRRGQVLDVVVGEPGQPRELRDVGARERDAAFEWPRRVEGQAPVDTDAVVRRTPPSGARRRRWLRRAPSDH